VTDKPVARVDAELEELMDMFFANTRQDLEAMRAALAAGDLATLRRLGHSLKGAGYNYFLEELGDMGRDLENACADNPDPAALAELVDRAAWYVDNVEIEYVEE
jgi:HPt (histidine-containing phosphotransfer) domain-containing protein